MQDSLREGEVVSLPCRWCASVSIEVKIQPGSDVKPCPKCGEFTHFNIKRGPTGLEISSKSAVRRLQPNDLP